MDIFCVFIIQFALSDKELCLYNDGLVQNCSNSIANALELLQSCTKPPICVYEKICLLW